MLVYQRVEGYKQLWTEGNFLNVKRPWNHLENIRRSRSETNRPTSRFLAIIQWNILPTFCPMTMRNWWKNNTTLIQKNTFRTHIVGGFLKFRFRAIQCVLCPFLVLVTFCFCFVGKRRSLDVRPCTNSITQPVLRKPGISPVVTLW